MIPAIGPVSKADDVAVAAVSPVSVRPTGDVVKVSQSSAAAIPAAPVPTLPADDGTADELIYTSTVRTIPPVSGPGSVTIPGIAVFPGLVEQPMPGADVKYEIHMGGVLVARIYENGVATTASGFDMSKLGFPSEAEKEMTPSEVADSRLEKLSTYFKTLDVAFDVFDAQGRLLTLDDEGPAVVARSIAQQY